MTNAIGGKLIIGQRGAALFVEGVEVVDRLSRKMKVVKCGQEVIVCAGALGSPQLLMLSGIGPTEHLKQHNIPVYKNLPAVGNNLVCNFRACSTNIVLTWKVARPLCCIDCVQSSHEPFIYLLREATMDNGYSVFTLVHLGYGNASRPLGTNLYLFVERILGCAGLSYQERKEVGCTARR